MRLPLGREPLGLETCRRAQVESLGAERLEAEWLRSFHSLAMTLRHSLKLDVHGIRRMSASHPFYTMNY
jgi:hypothetical protein